jgi:peptidoglycan/xylan/chitin deacetylase (PgdA/CDA1 family)
VTVSIRPSNGTPQRGLEAGEQDVWVSRDQFVALLDRVQARRDVTITFDDGNASDVEYALPALQERGLTATFFVVAGRLGYPGFLDADDVLALADAGMEIGCHGMRHRPWRGLDDAALHQELVDAKAVLENVVGRPLTRAACPFGSYDRRVLRTLRRAGYAHVFTSDRGTTRATAFVQARNSIGPHDEPGVLEVIPSRDGLSRRAQLAVKRWR